MDINCESEWDNLSNDDREPRITEKDLAQTTQKSVQKFRKLWDWYLPSFSTIPRLFANTPPRFNMEVLFKRYKRTSADTLSSVDHGSPRFVIFAHGRIVPQFTAFENTAALYQFSLFHIVHEHGLYFTAFSHTVAYWQLSRFHGVLVRGRGLTALYSAEFTHEVAFWQLSPFHSVLAHGCILAALFVSRCSHKRLRFGSSLYLTVFSHTVAFWQLSLFHSVLVHGLILVSLYFTVFSHAVAFWQLSFFHSLSHTVAFWQVSLFHSSLVIGRILAALSISQCSSMRSHFCSSLYFTVFSQTVAFWLPSLFQCSRTHSHFGSSLSRRRSHLVALSMPQCFRTRSRW